MLWRSSTFELRASWFLGIWMLFDAMGMVHNKEWTLLPFAVIVPFVSIYIHAMAHVAVARLVGGSCDGTMLSMLNDITVMHLPAKPAPHFAAGSAGPLVSLLLWLGCDMAMHNQSNSYVSQLLPYIARTNQGLVLYNLLACSVFDGARIWRSVFWPLVGLKRAVHWTAILGIVCAVALIGFGIYSMNMLAMFFGMMCLFTGIHEYGSIRAGYDPVTMVDLQTFNHYEKKRSWLGRWLAERRMRADQALAKEAEREQELLDGLLAKVTEQGLNSLTPAERATLQKISKRQRERENAHVG